MTRVLTGILVHLDLYSTPMLLVGIAMLAIYTTQLQLSLSSFTQ